MELANIIGFNPDDSFTTNIDILKNISDVESLLKFNEFVLKIIDFYKTVTGSVRGQKRIWKENKESIVQLIKEISSHINTKEACALLDITVQKFYRWGRETICTSSPLALCRKLHPGQLTINEQNNIEIQVKSPENSHLKLVQIYYKMMRDGLACMSIKSFYEYARKFNQERIHIRKVKNRIGIRAKTPFEILHMDTTIMRTMNGTRVYIHFIRDNFSRAILGWKVSLQAGSFSPAQNLREICEKYNLFNKDIQLICDDGSENKGEVSLFLKREDVKLNKLIAQIDIIESNSMAEAANKIMKYQFLFPQKPFDEKDVIRILEKAVPAYNNCHPGVLFGLSPNEVLKGEIPDKNMFKEKIQAAKAKRPEINRNQTCGSC